MEQIKQYAGVRSRSRPWFDETIEALARLLPARDDMFVNELDVIAHLAFAFAKKDVGGRVNVRLLTIETDDDYPGDPHVLVTHKSAQVSYIDPALQVAVITLQNPSRTITIRTDAVVQIEAVALDLALDTEKVPELTPVRL